MQELFKQATPFSRNFYIQFPQPLTLAHSIVLRTIKNQVSSSVTKVDFPPFTNTLTATQWLARFSFLHFLLKPLVCNKNITSSTKMNQVIFLVLPLHFLPLSHNLLQILKQAQILCPLLQGTACLAFSPKLRLDHVVLI